MFLQLLNDRQRQAIFIWVAFFLSLPANSQEKELRLFQPRVASRPDSVNDKDKIQEKRNENSNQLQSAIQASGDGSNQNNKPAVEANSQEIDARKKIDSVLARQQTAESNQKEISQRIDSLKNELDQQTDSESLVISFVEYDRLRNNLDSNEAKSATIENSIKAAEETVASARTQLEKSQADLRAAKEAVANNQNPDFTADLENAVKSAELAEKLAKETLQLNESLLQNEKQNLEANRLLIQSINKKLDTKKSNIEFKETHLQEILVQIESQESNIRQLLGFAESNLQYAENEWAASQKKHDLAPANKEFKEELVAKRAVRQLRQTEVDVINLKLARLTNVRETWNRRYKVFNRQATNDNLAEWSKEAKKSVLDLERERQVQQLNSKDIRTEISSLDSRVTGGDQNVDQLRPLIQIQIDAWRGVLLAADDNLASIESAIRLHKNLIQEIDGEISTWTFSERAAAIWNKVKAVWYIEITNLEDRPITIGKVFTGLLLLFVGFFSAKLLSRMVGNRLLTRFGMNQGASAAIKSIVFYALIVIFSLLALRIANVPLTIFTLMGGALAIGIGFGSQAIINNFISGLILIAERPMQVGDLVKLDDLVGNVVHIGARSTRVRTGDNLDIIVPNSKFLENNVLNFTLGDDQFRSQVKVGIAYGSSTRDATKLLIKAAENHGLVLSDPKPFVWFADFGDNALLFELHVWIKVRTLGERKRIESDLRYHIEQLFNEAGIVIAFPQRDVHLDVQRPIPVDLIQKSA